MSRKLKIRLGKIDEKWTEAQIILSIMEDGEEVVAPWGLSEFYDNLPWMEPGNEVLLDLDFLNSLPGGK